MLQHVREYAPQLATLVKSIPLGDEWLHEVKFDGYRIGIVRRGRVVQLITRNGNDWTDRYPAIVDAARALDVDSALIDGELAIVLPDGRTSFQALQNAATMRGTLTFFAFDLLELDGDDLCGEPLEGRKQRLRRLLPTDAPALRYSDHVIGDGVRVFDEACRAGIEGVISKQRTAPVQPGRSRTWLKTKCVLRQEFVIGGFTDPEGARTGIGALLVGYYDDGRLAWAGKVGTGFTDKSARDLRRQLARLEQPASPFTPPPPGRLGRLAHWVAPTLVAEVAFTEWTEGGKVRHPSFQGLRDDKRATSVVREQPVAATDAARVPPRVSRHAPATPRATRATGRPVVAGVAISNPDRVMYPRPRITKLDLARYYEAVAAWMLPHVTGRPLTLLVCPEGIRGECSFLKHGKAWGPKALRRVRIREKTKTGEYMVIESVAGLVSLMQMNWIEAHTWNSTTDHLEAPDRLVFDLDPGPRVSWADVVDAARQVREALSALRLTSWVKTTGGRGLHVVVPVRPERDWRECLEFARAFAEVLAAQDRARYTTEFAKAGRERKILIDYLRNNRTNTSIAAYSPRARAGAPVSMPLAWDDLHASLRPAEFTVLTVPARLAASGEAWSGYWRSRQRLSTAVTRSVERRAAAPDRGRAEDRGRADPQRTRVRR